MAGLNGDLFQARRGRRIAVIGGGFSGSLLAIHLKRNSRPGDRIYLFEKRSGFGRGIAYSTGNPDHLLNVRAKNMSAFPDVPDHFVGWLEVHASRLGLERPAAGFANAFVPRRVFGAYVQDLLEQEIAGERTPMLYLVPDAAVALQKRSGSQLGVETACGRIYEVDRVALAFGNVPPGVSRGVYCGDPWAPEVLADLDPESPVLILGTGLTMVDTVLALVRSGHRGRIVASSRRGLLPHAHAESAPLPLDDLAARLAASDSVAERLALVRDAVRRSTVAGEDWRSVIDGLRPHTRTLWRSLSDGAKRRFLRHLRPWWDIHRHRIAPHVAEEIRALLASGRLSILPGRLVAMTTLGRAAQIDLRRRGAPDCESLSFARVIDCRGPQSDLDAMQDPLVRALVAEGVIQADPLKLGIHVDADDAVIGHDGRPSARIFAVGPPTRGVHWEMTAVPDIRGQCAALAARLLPAEQPERSGNRTAIPVPRPFGAPQGWPAPHVSPPAAF